MNDKPLITIVVPVYNVERYIYRCVESLLLQTYKNIEIIIVDDGSTDKSGSICDELAKNNSSITVYHKKNGGLSDARNYGTKRASGSYISFIDSDDYVSCDYIEYLYNILKKHCADISVCSEFRTELDKSNFNESSSLNNITILNGADCCVEYFRQPFHMTLVTATGKLIKADIVRNNPFPVGRIHEDEATTYKYFYSSNKVVIGNRMLYAYYQNPHSITHKRKDFENKDLIWALEQRAIYFEKRKEARLSKYAWSSLVSFLLLDNLLNDGRNNEKMKNIFLSKKLLIKLKLRTLFYLCFESLYRKIYTINN